MQMNAVQEVEPEPKETLSGSYAVELWWFYVESTQPPTNLIDEISNLRKELEAANAQISYLTTSRTYRIGRAITWPFVGLKKLGR